MSLNLNEHSVSEIAEAIYFDIVETLGMTNDCINYLIDGSSENTVRGQEFYFEIEDALTRAFESLEERA